MRQIYILLFSVFPFLCYSQAPTIKWLKSYGGSNVDMAYAICKTPEGGLIVGGNARSTNGDITNNIAFEDCWLVKVDSNGNKLWVKNYGGRYFDGATAIQPTKDSGYILMCETTSADSNITNYQGNMDYWVIKLDKDGNKQWDMAYGGGDYDYGEDIKQTPDGGYILLGFTVAINGEVEGNHGGFDAWVVKIDSTGNIQWKKTYGGSGDDDVFKIELTADGGYAFAGLTRSSDGDVTGNHGGADVWLVKINSEGKLQWQKCLGGSGTDAALSFKITPDGGYIIAANSSSTDGDLSGLPHSANQDFWMVKLNSAGNIIWQKIYGGGGDDVLRDVLVTKDGSYLFTGYTESYLIGDDPKRTPPNAWFFNCESDGTPRWEKFIGGTGADYSCNIIEYKDGYAFAGFSYSNNMDVTGNHGDYDYLIGRLSLTTLPITLTSFTAQKQHNDVLLNWQTATEINSKQFNIQRSSDGDRFTTIGTIPAAGNSASPKMYAYNDVEAGLQTGMLYYRLEQVDKDGSKYYSKVAVIKNLPADVFTVMPNPVKSVITIQSKINAARATMQLSDMNGKVIYSSNKAISTGYLQIPAANLAAGNYTLNILANGDKYVVKVVKE